MSGIPTASYTDKVIVICSSKFIQQPIEFAFDKPIKLVAVNKLLSLVQDVAVDSLNVRLRVEQVWAIHFLVVLPFPSVDTPRVLISLLMKVTVRNRSDESLMILVQNYWMFS